MSRIFTRALGVTVVAFLVLTGAGCNLAPPPDKPKAAVKEERRVPVEKVKTVEEPSEWPEEIPLYPEAELKSAEKVGEEWVLTLSTKRTASDIFIWYYDELEAKEWNMLGPTLDVAQNVALIKGKLNGNTMYMEARTDEERDGRTTLTLRVGPSGPEPPTGY